MANSSSVSMSSADLACVVEKLDRFSQTLSPAEQVVLSDLLQQALIVASEHSEVQGYSLATLPIPEGGLLAAFEIA